MVDGALDCTFIAHPTNNGNYIDVIPAQAGIHLCKSRSHKVTRFGVDW